MSFVMIPLPAELYFQWLTKAQILGNYRLEPALEESWQWAFLYP